MNIYQKLVEVRKNIDGFTKDASGYGYKYVSGSQVLTKMKSTMDAQGVILETHLTNPVVTNSGKGSLVTSPMKMIWVNAEKPEDRIVIDWFMAGEQKDPSQALGSGLTYSERYFLLKFFGISTDEDDPDKITDKNNDKLKGNPEKGKIMRIKNETDVHLKNRLLSICGGKGHEAEAKAEYERIIKEENPVTEEALSNEVETYLEQKFDAVEV